MYAVGPRLHRWLPALLLAAAWAATLPLGIGAKSSSTRCAIDGATFMAFGNYDPMSNSPLDLQGRVSYRCYSDQASSDNNRNGSYDDDDDDDGNGNGGGSVNVQISINAGNAGGFNRYMAGTRDRLHYNLFLDPQRHAVWGDGTGGTQVYSDQAQSDNQVVVVPVYGRAFGAQDVSAGTYLDQLIVTLDF